MQNILKPKGFSLTRVMAKPDLDEHEATGCLFTRQSVNIHRSGCRNVNVFGGAAPRPCCGDYVIYWMCSTLPF